MAADHASFDSLVILLFHVRSVGSQVVLLLVVASASAIINAG